MTSVFFPTVFCMAAGYLIGGLNPAYLAAKLRGFDIRERGSGNAGASNAMITMGKGIGFLIALFDIAKAYFAVWLARRFFPNLTYAAEVAGICTILGHIFPFAMGFRGGKGLACLGGVVMAFNARVFWFILLGELILALIVDYIFVVPLTASVIFPVVYYFITGRILGTILYVLLIPIFFYKHQDNLRRFRAGQEARFSYLWSKDEKVRRMAEEIRGK